MAKKYKYTAKCHLMVDGAGHVWPNDKDNRTLRRKTVCVLTEAEAARYGDSLVKLGQASA